MKYTLSTVAALLLGVSALHAEPMNIKGTVSVKEIEQDGKKVKTYVIKDSLTGAEYIINRKLALRFKRFNGKTVQVSKADVEEATKLINKVGTVKEVKEKKKKKEKKK